MSRAKVVPSAPSIKADKVLNNGEMKMNENGITVLSLFDGKYAACSDGTIISYARKNPKKLIGKIGSAGYRMVVLTIDNKKQYHNVHRIIAKAFIPNPKGLREVNHKDGLESKCKINMDIANKIRADVGTHRELAKKYGLKKTEIGLIRQNKRWVA